MNNPLYPLGYKVGHYRQARRLALASAQAAGILWEFRWGASTGDIAYIKRVTLKAVQIANATAEELRFNLKIARTFTAANTTNTASILTTGNSQQLQTPYAASTLTAFRESNSATAATGGTLTQDTDSIAQGSFVSLATISTTDQARQDIVFDFNPLAESDQLLGLRQDEGWVINLEAAKGATTGVVLIMETAWAEATVVGAI